MSSFPKLKTDAVLQYPARRDVQFANEVLRFLDGSEQKYRGKPGAQRRWAIRLDRIDESEAVAIEEFFNSNQGQFASFLFTDPWTGVEYPDCSIEGGAVEFEWSDEMRGRAALVVVENG